MLGLTLGRPDGKLNRNWFLTALPFFACLILLPLGAAGALRPQTPASWSATLDVVATGVAAASIALMFLTWGTHRVPLSLWHQVNDAPRGIVTVGPYRAVRHPFYAAFLLAVISVVLVLPDWATALTFIYAIVGLNITAAREERRLSVSEFGAEYRAYIRRTGRFVPRPVIIRGLLGPSRPG
jgi:protein-S-isoprenylcysteine O-methyltransferase Ste14